MMCGAFRRMISDRAAVLLVWALCACSPAHTWAAAPAPFVPGQILVKFKPGIATGNQAAFVQSARLQPVRQFAAIGVQCYRLQAGEDVAAAIRACQSDPAVEFAEPNYIYSASRLPDDPRFGELWGLDADADTDIDAPEAWDRQTGDSRVLVAIIDTGVDYTHEDLAGNMWRNPGETGSGRETNGQDDDHNGFVDDVVGWDFAGNDNDPKDDNGHGSHVAGTIAAVGNNGKGVVGVNWRASIMALKFLSANGSGSASDAINAILYAANNGARVLNNSWGGGGFSQALRDAIDFARQKDAVFVAAAGNEGSDNDRNPSYPASYDLSNVLSVAAVDRAGALATFSNFGRTAVDLAAPGVDILSSVPGNGYRSLSGTSMAAPHVSGVAALVLAQNPRSSAREVLVRIAGSVRPVPALENATWSGGRLDAADALSDAPKVAFVTRLADTMVPKPGGVDAEAVDDSAIASATLHFAAGSGAAQTLPMQRVGSGVFHAEIPAQTAGATVAYFVEVMDVTGNAARSRSHSFKTGSTAGAPGCGGFATKLERSRDRVLAVLGNALLLLCGLAAARRWKRVRHAPVPYRR